MADDGCGHYWPSLLQNDLKHPSMRAVAVVVEVENAEVLEPVA